MQLNIHNWAEIISAVICIICFWNKPSILNRWFVCFLILTVEVELIGKLTSDFPDFKILMYNLFNGVEFIFYFSIFYQLNRKKNIRRILLIEILLFAIFFSINLFFIQGLTVYNNYTTTIGSILLLVACLTQYLEIATWEIKEDFELPFLFVISGLLIFYAGNFFNYAIFNYTVRNDTVTAKWLYKLINNNLNVILYGAFSSAFIIEFFKEKKLTIKLSFRNIYRLFLS